MPTTTVVAAYTSNFGWTTANGTNLAAVDGNYARLLGGPLSEGTVNFNLVAALPANAVNVTGHFRATSRVLTTFLIHSLTLACNTGSVSLIEPGDGVLINTFGPVGGNAFGLTRANLAAGLVVNFTVSDYSENGVDWGLDALEAVISYDLSGGAARKRRRFRFAGVS